MQNLHFDAKHRAMLCKQSIMVDGELMNLQNAKIVSRSRQCSPWKLSMDNTIIYVGHKKCNREICVRSKKQCIGTCPGTLLFTKSKEKAKNFKPKIEQASTETSWTIYMEHSNIKQNIKKLCLQPRYSDSEESD